MARYIFITGGVVSSLGKGLASAALGALLQARGYKVRLRKLDPYLNVDPGTMSPYQHGEVYVTDDGAEADLDLGHYERFTGVPARGCDSISAGKVYARARSRRLRPPDAGALSRFRRRAEDQTDPAFGARAARHRHSAGSAAVSRRSPHSAGGAAQDRAAVQR